MKFENLRTDWASAMKYHEAIKKDVLSSAIAAVKKAAIDEGCRDNPTDELVDIVLRKELKTAKEMIDTCPASRSDLLETYTEKFNILDSYVPKLLTDEGDIRMMILELAEELGAEPSNAMRLIMPKLKGKVDMKVAQKVMKELF